MFSDEEYLVTFCSDTMREEEKELRVWLDRHSDKLKDLSHQEVLWWALMNTFNEKLVYDVLTTYRFYLGKVSVASGVALHLWRVEETIALKNEMEAKMKRKKSPLTAVWEDLHAYQTGEVLI